MKRLAWVLLGLSFFAYSLSGSKASPANGRIAGEVLWFGGPYQVYVTIVGPTSATVLTDEAGQFSTSVAPGHYAVTAPGPWASHPLETHYVTVESGEGLFEGFYFW